MTIFGNLFFLTDDQNSQVKFETRNYNAQKSKGSQEQEDTYKTHGRRFDWIYKPKLISQSSHPSGWQHSGLLMHSFEQRWKHLVDTSNFFIVIARADRINCWENERELLGTHSLNFKGVVHRRDIEDTAGLTREYPGFLSNLDIINANTSEYSANSLQ